MTTPSETKEDIILKYTLCRNVCGGKTLRTPISPTVDIVAEAQRVAKEHMSGAQTLVSSFVAYIGTICDGAVLERSGIFPRSYFGEDVAITVLPEECLKFNRAVATDSGELYPLEPGERVYNLATGQLVYEEPICT